MTIEELVQKLSNEVSLEKIYMFLGKLYLDYPKLLLEHRYREWLYYIIAYGKDVNMKLLVLLDELIQATEREENIIVYDNEERRHYKKKNTRSIRFFIISKEEADILEKILLQKGYKRE